MSQAIYRALLQGSVGGGGGGGGGGGCGVVLATAYDDNFDCGSSVDTAGTRFSGANAWSPHDGGFSLSTPATFTQSGGILTAFPGNYLFDMYPIGYRQSFPAGNCTFVSKMRPLSIPGIWGGMGLLLRESATGKMLAATLIGAGSSMGAEVRRMTTGTYYGWTASYTGSFTGGAANAWHWVEVGRSGTTLTFRASNNGSSWTDICTAVAQTADFTTTADQIAWFVNQANVGPSFTGEFDSFARTA
jgi:hypothetical protein